MQSSCKEIRSFFHAVWLVLLLMPTLFVTSCNQALAEGPAPVTAQNSAQSSSPSSTQSSTQSSAQNSAVIENVPVDEVTVQSKLNSERQARRASRKRKFATENALNQANQASDEDKQNSSTANFPGRRRRAVGAGLNPSSASGVRARDINPAMGRSALDLSHLNLSDEQKTRITALRSKTRGKGKEIMLSIKAKRTELRELMFDPSISAAQIKAKAAELRNLVTDMEANKLDDFLAIRSTLNPDQVKKLRPGATKGMADAGPSNTGPSSTGPSNSAASSASP